MSLCRSVPDATRLADRVGQLVISLSEETRRDVFYVGKIPRDQACCGRYRCREEAEGLRAAELETRLTGIIAAKDVLEPVTHASGKLHFLRESYGAIARLGSQHRHWRDIRVDPAGRNDVAQGRG